MGALEPWAKKVIALLGSYVEVSPSGTGVKVFFLYRTSDLAKCRSNRWVAEGGGRAFKRGDGEAHPPAIEVYLAGRWFAVTDRGLDGAPAELRRVGYDALCDLLGRIGPDFERGEDRVIPMGGPVGAVWPRIQDAAEKDGKLHDLLYVTRHDRRDRSRSAMALGAALARHSFTYDEVCDAIRTWPPTVEWCREKGDANNGRELRRIWDKTQTRRRENPGWGDGLDIGPRGEPLPTLKNVHHAVRHAPELAGLIRLDQFSGFPQITRRPPWDEKDEGDTPRRLRETDLSHLKVWLEGRRLTASMENVQAAVAMVAEEHGFHPPQDYLRGLIWDQVPRLDLLFPRYFFAEDTPLHRAFGRFLIAAVARVMQPGAKVDTALILEGAQGIGKSSAARVLAGGEWFGEDLPEIGTKDAGLYIQGRWVVELAELTNVTKSEADVVKRFLSTSVDRFRAPYARSTEDHPRQCVFIGTVNPNGRGYLKDETGNRRFWIVECKEKVDLAGLAADRDQLWAEARHRYEAGELWYLDSDELEAAQAAVAQERRDTDPLIEQVRKQVARHEYAEKDALLRLLTTTHTSRADESSEHTRPATRADDMRLASIMRDLGWVMERRRGGGGEKRRVYVRTEAAEPMEASRPHPVEGDDAAF
ncbi:VapE domain-containing protein [Roseomonas sp. WA12]